MVNALDQRLLDALRALDGPSIANAIETRHVRLRNEGFSDSRVRALFGRLPPVVGHAVTARIRCSSPPPVGHTYIDRTDLWAHVLAVPAPRILVVQDIDEHRGAGAFVGHVHACILRALGCEAFVTDGAVRDLPEVEAMGFSLFAGGVSVSHGFVHLVDFDRPVEIAGLPVATGDLLFGDVHGLVNIPLEVAAELPALVARMQAQEQQVIDFCESPQFSLDALQSLVSQLP